MTRRGCTRSLPPSPEPDLLNLFGSVGERVPEIIVSAILKDILLTLGLDYRPFETKAHLIDLSLLDRRNKIAHGEFLEISRQGFIDLSMQVVDLLVAFRTQVSNAAARKSFLRAA